MVISIGGFIHWWSLVVISNGYSILNGHLWWYGGYIHWWYANMVVNQWIWDIPFSDKPNMDIVRIWSDKSCCDLTSQRHILKWWLGFGESSPNGRKIFRRDVEPFIPQIYTLGNGQIQIQFTPQDIFIHFNRIFHEINHPAIGVPPFQEPPNWGCEMLVAVLTVEPFIPTCENGEELGTNYPVSFTRK